MRNYIRLYLFVLLIGGIFVYIGNAIPQISTSEGAIVEIASKSPDQLAEAGKAIVEGKGRCLLCHSIQESRTARAPEWEGVGGRASTRKPGMSAAEYLVESLYNPDAFVVEGYSKNQMKPANKNPIGLTDTEILAVISYLFGLGGEINSQIVSAIEVAQKPWMSDETTATSAPARQFTFPEGDSLAGKELFDEAGCSACHEAPGFEWEEDAEYIGPNLANIASIQNTDYLFESIVDPNAVIVRTAGSEDAGSSDESRMPEFRDILTVGQVFDLVAFLETLKERNEK
jgi:cytochrome c2